nr:PREDICTED: NHL repeat-containing protein 2 [Bemisia tabaci]
MENTMDAVFDASMSLVGEFSNFDGNTDDRNKLIWSFLEKIHRDKNLDKVSDFRNGLEWMNTTQPLSLHKDLTGKIIILDFFTYCCINCMHILPDLKALENAFPVERGLVVIGVHSAKFANERNTQNIVDAVQRYEISHPVVNDNGEQMWHHLCVNCWPTLIVIAPDLRPLLVLQGEGHRALLFALIEKAVEFYTKEGILSNHRLTQIQITKSFNASKLSYPGKIATHENSVTFSDSGNHRIILIQKFGSAEEKILTIGGIVSGFKDGSFLDARFHSPQGVAFLDDNTIIVADTENHALRKIDLKCNKVETLSGTGAQGFNRIGGKKGTNQILSSPWDVCINSEKTIVFIAMAGLHQIWAYFLADTSLWGRSYSQGVCAAVAGNGKEENRNNLYPMSSAFAQPSGICISEEINAMFIADSESSSIRAIELGSGKVKAVVGGARDPHNLFAFGDTDGVGTTAQLQHPLGVTWNQNNQKLYVADTYNHKIKEINVKENSARTLKVDQTLKEPTGLCCFGQKMLIADTNNHRILKYDPESGKTEIVNIKLEACKPSAKCKNIVKQDKISLSPKGGSLKMNLSVILPNGCSITKKAPSKWLLSPPDTWKTIKAGSEEFQLKEQFEFQVPEQNTEIKSSNLTAQVPLIIECFVYYCTPTSTCSQHEFSILLEVSYEEEASSNASYDFSHSIIS